MMNLIWTIPLVIMIVGLGMFILIRMEEVFAVSFSLGPGLEGAYEMNLSIDSFSLLFLMTVGLVSTLVLIYSDDYFDDSSLFKKKFFFTLTLFICSMFILSLSGDLLWAMVGWDGLGITSFGLIVFYQNWKSFNSAMVTFLTNRLGDFFMISSMVIILFMKGDVKFWSEEVGWLGWVLVGGALTKSAQVPFSSWLPLAMAAPTPVSSLVHSSTLVTAGVFIMIRFNLFLNENLKNVVCLIGILTIFLAGISSMGEYDLKKIIALSTLSHIGLMVMFIGLGSILSAKIHLCIHALFKSVLFMTAGNIIHLSKGCQDIRALSLISSDMITSSTFLISALSMMGMPFLAGFYSKEIMFESSFFEPSLLSLVGFLSSVLMTCAYSIRLIYYLYSSPPFLSATCNSSKGLSLVYLLGTIFSGVIGGMMVVILVEKEYTETLSFFSPFMKVTLLTSILVGGIVGGVGASNFHLLPWKLSVICHFMWMIHSVSKVSQKSFFLLSHFSLFQSDIKGSVDYLTIQSMVEFKSLSNGWIKDLIISPLQLISLLILFFMISLVFLL